MLDDHPRERWRRPFTHQEALEMFARMVAGWANSLDESGTRTLINGITMPGQPDSGGSYEGFTRMMWGLGGWLSQPARPVSVTWKGVPYDIAALARRGMANGCNPNCPSGWGYNTKPGSYDQRTVEAGHTMFNLWQAREKVWQAMTPQERENIIRYHELYGQRPTYWASNWALFWACNHASRKALGEPYDQELIDSVLNEYLEGVYLGDGWYDDGPVRGTQHFDDYNWWVFGTHSLIWAMVDGDSCPEKREELLERTRLGLKHYPYFFASNGAYTEYGRSLSYKFARLGTPLFAYKLGAWPYSAGMLKRLVGRHLRWYFDRGGVAADGTLIQPLTYQGSPSIRDPYISTGSTYWAMQAFGGLWSLPDDDPFWNAEEEPLPVEQGDFVRVFPQPGWVAVGTQKTGQVQRFNAGSVHGGPNYQATYHKYVYATAAPFNTGLVNGSAAPDAMLSLSDGVTFSHRQDLLAHAVGEPGWLRMRYTAHAAGLEHFIDTTILCMGEMHLRAHRISLHPRLSAPISAVEGAGVLGYAPGMYYETSAGEPGEPLGVWIPAGIERSAFGRGIAIRSLRGYDGQAITSAWQGHTSLNSVYGEYVLPMLTVRQVQPTHELVCLVHIGSDRFDDSFATTLPEIVWLADGAVQITWDAGRELTIPALKG